MYRKYQKMEPRKKYLYRMSLMWYIALSLDIVVLIGAAIFCYFCIVNTDSQTNKVPYQKLAVQPQPKPRPTNQPPEIAWGLTPLIPD